MSTSSRNSATDTNKPRVLSIFASTLREKARRSLSVGGVFRHRDSIRYWKPSNVKKPSVCSTVPLRYGG